jgi:hypothetical protein
MLKDEQRTIVYRVLHLPKGLDYLVWHRRRPIHPSDGRTKGGAIRTVHRHGPEGMMGMRETRIAARTTRSPPT